MDNVCSALCRSVDIFACIRSYVNKCKRFRKPYQPERFWFVKKSFFVAFYIFWCCIFINMPSKMSLYWPVSWFVLSCLCWTEMLLCFSVMLISFMKFCVVYHEYTSWLIVLIVDCINKVLMSLFFIVNSGLLFSSV